MEEYYEVPESEIEAVASYWYDVLEKPEISKSDRSLALSYLALYTTIKEIEELGGYGMTTYPPSDTYH